MKKSKGKGLAPDTGSQLIAKSQIHPCPFNPRRKAGATGLDELKDSIEKTGLLNAITVRKVGQGYQIIAGSRRFAAFYMIYPESTPIPCKVVEMDDQKAREASIVENIQREDLPPIDEAKSYADLMKGSKMTVGDVAAKCGKRWGYVQQRLKLLDLGKEGVKALEDGKLPLILANVLARVPDQKDREEAVKAILSHISRGENPSASDVREFIADNYECKLSSAPWPKDKEIQSADRTPVTLAPCSTCQFNTSNQDTLPGLPQEDKKDSRCASASCFKKKIAAWSAIIAEKARKSGADVVTGKEAEKALDSNEYIKLDDQNYHSAGYKTWRSLLKGKEYKVLVAIRPEDGRAFELVKEAEAERLTSGGKKKAADPVAKQQRVQANREKAKMMAGMSVVAVMGLGEAKKIKDPVAKKLLGFLSDHLLHKAPFDTFRAICKRRGIDPKQGQFGKDYSAALDSEFKKMSFEDQVGLMLEALGADGFGYRNEEDLKKVLQYFGVKYSEVRVEEEKKAEPKKAKK